MTTYSNSLATLWAFIASRRQQWRPEPPTRQQFREYILPIGITTALEIGFSNIALNILTVSFGTILKGGAPVFTMLWGILLGIESFSANLCLSLTTIALGIALASFGEGHTFAVHGFVLQLLATALGGLRWAMTQVLIGGKKRNEGENEEGSEERTEERNEMPPLTATLYTSPMTAICVLPFAAFLEGANVANRIQDLEPNEGWVIILTMTIVATLVFILLVSEFWLVKATSSLALSVAGVFKELITIAGGIIIFAEHMTSLNIIGFAICQVGIVGYIYIRSDKRQTASDETSSTEDVPLRPVEVSDVSDPEDGFEPGNKSRGDATSIRVGR